MPEYLDPQGVSYLWSKIKNITQHNIIFQSKTVEQWNIDKFLISKKDVLYIYTNYKTIVQDEKELVIPGLKLGDGNSYLIDLPFLNNDRFERVLLEHINNGTIHVSPEDRWFWNNKINVNAQIQEENLVFNRL